MKKKVLLSMAVFAMIFSSCVKNSAEYKRLQAENDALALINAKNENEIEEFLSLLNEVEENFKNIKSAENYLSVQSYTPGELVPSVKERILSDMQLITETLEKNRQIIAELEEKVKKSSLPSAQLQQTINKLRLELDQKTMALVTLNEELARKNEQIAELNTSVSNLSRDVQELRVQSNTQQKIIIQQEKVITTVYYCFGTSNELKNQNILVNNQLGTNFNPNYFIKVPDFNTLRVIQLWAKKGKLISKHPEGSYEFIKDAYNQVELHILDTASFWSLTKYLVVLVNV